MNDLRLTTAPKSDQLNADDLIGRTLTIVVTKVTLDLKAAQPVAIHYDGGRPFMPCKSMRRVMVAVWGDDGNTYAGRSMTLYTDPEVTYGGQQLGGIRISHMSGIDKPVTLALTATRANRKPFTVKPLAEIPPVAPKRTLGAYLVEKLSACQSTKDVDDLVANDPVIGQNVQKPAVQQAIADARARFETTDLRDDEEPFEDDFPGDLVAREQNAAAVVEGG